MSAIAILGGHVYGQSNSGAAPFLDSKHAYRVKIGKKTNTQDWYMVNEAGTINEKLTDGTSRDWVSIEPALADNDFEIISITYNSQDAFTAVTGFTVGNWFLRFEETSIDDGTCVSAREFPITISDNSFWLQVSHDETDVLPLPVNLGLQVFNSQNSKVNTYTDLLTNTYDTPVKYTVTMNKGAGFSPTYWQFHANFLSPVKSFTATVTTTNGGTLEQTTVTAGSEYTVKVTPPTGFNLDQVVVTISVVYTHDVLVDVTRDLKVDQGFAVQVPAVATPQPPSAITDDNITTYPLGEAGNRTQAVTILAIPSTKDILFDNSINTNENATSSKNPLQNSTHYYKVEKGAIGNGCVWRIEGNDGQVFDGTNYTLSSTNELTKTNAFTNIDFGTLPLGSYSLYCTETDAVTGANTQRVYPINVLGPLDVDIAAGVPTCATVSGQINNLNATDKTNGVLVHETTTTVDYTIDLISTDYFADWYFTFEVSGDNVAFDPLSNPVSDLEVTGISTLTSGVAYTASTSTKGTVKVTNSQTTKVTKAVISVTYNGIYQSSHNVKIALTDITGSYSEADADATNETIHAIHAMPQAGELAGVD